MGSPPRLQQCLPVSRALKPPYQAPANGVSLIDDEVSEGNAVPQFLYLLGRGRSLAACVCPTTDVFMEGPACSGVRGLACP